jgi:hypothetical protein
MATEIAGQVTKQPGKLDAFQPCLRERMKVGLWNPPVLLGALQERSYKGGYPSN